MHRRPWWAWMVEAGFVAMLGLIGAALWFYARANNWADGSEKYDVGFTTLVGLGSAALTRIMDRHFGPQRRDTREDDDDADV